MRVAIPKKIRDQVKAKFEGHCAYCGQKPSKLQIDHLIPVSRANYHREINVNGIDNLMPVCHPCNNYKLCFDLEQFRNMISEQVGKCRQYSVNFRTAERYGLVQETPNPVVFYFEKIMENK